MNKIAIILILLLAVTFIPLSADNGKVISLADSYRGEGYVAFVANEKDVVQDEKDNKDEVVKCDCKGTGVMVHGDGHKTPCLCKATGECKCDKSKDPLPTPPAPAPKKPGLDRKVCLYFTADWCGPCQTFKKQYPNMDKLAMDHSDIDDKIETKMEVIDIDKNKVLYDQIKGKRNAIPLFIFLDKDNNEVGEFTGYQDYRTIIGKWNEYK